MKRFGFTLIELLIVVGTIAVLAAIAVPNFLEAQVRSKVSRSRQDMAVMTAALRSYHADYDVYPLHTSETLHFLQQCRNVIMVTASSVPTPTTASMVWTSDAKAPPGASINRSFGGSSYIDYYNLLAEDAWRLKVLTTPVAYFTHALPPDPFADRKGAPFMYVNIRQVYGGPEVNGVTLPRFILYSHAPATGANNPIPYNPVKGPYTSYDATNGTVSPGLLFETGSDIKHFQLLTSAQATSATQQFEQRSGGFI